METEVLQPTETPETPTPEVVEPAESIAEHAAQFQPEAQRERAEELAEQRRENAATQKRTDRGEFDSGRHRAKSQQAGPEDVETIRTLTKELRTKEEELRKAKPDAFGNDSPRVLTLKRQIRAIEADLAEAKPKPAPAPARSEPPARVAAPSMNGKAFDEKEPTIDDFLDKPDPYAEWTKEWNRWDRKRERFEESRQSEQMATENARQAYIGAHQQRLTAFAAKTPDFAEKTYDFAKRDIPAVLLNAVIGHDRGPEFVYYLAQNPSIADELVFQTAGMPLTDDFVATVQRRLLGHLEAAKTGSAPVARPYTPPKPPNPVRTGSVQPSDDPPGESGSIADHARYYGPK